MVFIHRLDAILIGITLSVLFAFTNAHSTARRGPIPSIGLIKDAQIHSEGTSARVHGFSEFSITFAVDRPYQEIKLSLEPNHDIIGHDTTIEYIGADGEVKKTEKFDRKKEKVFKGTAWVKEDDGWAFAGHARIYVDRDGQDPLFSGVFSVFGNDHHIQLRSGYMRTKHDEDPNLEGDEEFMVVVRDTDISEGIKAQQKRGIEVERSCSADDLAFNMDPNHKIRRQIIGDASKRFVKRDVSWNPLDSVQIFGKMKTKRQVDGNFGGGFGGGINLRTVIGDTSGCPSPKKVALMGIVADCEYVASFNNNAEDVRKNILKVVNEASTLFESTFNITLGLAQLIVSDVNGCPVSPTNSAPWNIPCSSANTTIEDRLNILSAWRGTRANDGLAFWTQLTNCPTGASVGLAWLGLLCQSEAQQQQSNTVSGANVVARTDQEYKVLAHEIGHTFGAVHDCTASACTDTAYVASSQCCPLSSTGCDANGQFLMNPSTGNRITSFSPCSIGNICSALGRGTVNGNCLTDNRNIPTVEDGICGNGIVEEGEECDSAGEGDCCDHDTCKFRQGAVCDPINEECCTSSCGWAAATTVCRNSNGPCDPQEFCTGNSSSCPTDANSPDGEACGAEGEGLYCASGHCTSRDFQCKSLVGVLQNIGNDTKSCDDSNCQLTCTSPQLGSGVCYGMQQWFVDGTKCGSGTCRSGTCVGNNVFNDVKNWVERNLPLVIGLSAGIGGLIVVAILWCCVRSCIRRAKRRKMRAAHPPILIPPQDMGYVAPPYPGPAPVPTPSAIGGRRLSRRASEQSSGVTSMSPRQQQQYSNQQYYNEQAEALNYYHSMRHGPADNNQSYYNNNNNNNNTGYPPYMPPVYQPQDGLQRGQSVRYA